MTVGSNVIWKAQAANFSADYPPGKVTTGEPGRAPRPGRSSLPAHGVATVLVDCSLRPEECFRLKPVHVRHGNLEIPWGKTENAVRKIPMTPRVETIIQARNRSRNGSSWLFPAPTTSGHIEPSSLKKQHLKACRLAKIEPFDL